MLRSGGQATAIGNPRYVDMYLDGRLHLDEMVSEPIRLGNIDEDFDDMKAGNVARSVVTFC